MPVTPFHLGAGAVIKAGLRENFSFCVFGFSQILIDLQPLFAMLGANIKLHGLSHTYLGATIITIIATLFGKPLCEFFLKQWNKKISIQNSSIFRFNETMTWTIATSSAFIGTYSHILLDSFMHSDLEPFYPFAIQNTLLDLIPMTTLHIVCLIAGIIGGIAYFSVNFFKKHFNK